MNHAPHPPIGVEVTHRTEALNGIDLHWVEAGDGPVVLMVHGFPESWYSWRHQLIALADAGYRAVAIDVRGYGGSSAPESIEAYRMVRHVADNVHLLDALGADTAVIVGHDWGAPIAWTSAWLRPDRFIAVAGLSVPFAGVGPTRPSDAFRALGGDEEFYIEYFQRPGRGEAEIEADVRRWLLGMYFSSSGDVPEMVVDGRTIATIAPGGQMSDRFSYPPDDPAEWPRWLTPLDLDFYTAEFERTGLAGALNRYRNVDRDWEDLQVLAGSAIRVPALFIGGDRDGPTLWGAPAIARFGDTLPALHDSIILEGSGHWTQQERPDEVNDALIGFLTAVGHRRAG